ncbi:MAG: tripartite tricarboxylate transporter permease [Bacteroidota bacterium]
MDIMTLLFEGFKSCLTATNIIACIIGVIVGTLTGVLPGLGSGGAMALLLPISFGMDPTAALIMLAGIYYGAMYGGSTTSILVNVPGESSSLMTCLDGHQMAKKGRAGAALTISAIGSFIAGTIGLILLTLFAPPISKIALSFGPPEYLAIAIMGLIALVLLSGSIVKGSIMMILGIMIGTIGLDPLSGINRFTMGSANLSKGIDFVLVAMGLFGLGEVVSMLCEKSQEVKIQKLRLRDLYPNREEIRRSVNPILRGSFLGFLCGLIPGPAAVVSTFLSYAVEKKVSKRPEEFGKGAVEGVAGPESANNAASSAAMVPLLTLGLPFAPPIAILLSGFLIHGITPGPSLITEHPGVFWGLLASMYIGNLLLLIINLPFVGVFASLLKTPKEYLMPIIVIISFTGALALNGSVFDLGVLILFGFMGYILREIGYQPASLAIGVILGPIIEKSLTQSLILFDGKISSFFTRPFSAVFLSLAIIFLIAGIYGNLKKYFKAQGRAKEIIN